MRSIRIILCLAGKHLRVLSRMRAIMAVMLLPGIVLYTVFTLIFSGPAGAVRPFRVAVVDLDDTAESRQLIDALSKGNVVVIRTEDESPDGTPLTVETAREFIRKKGKFRVALVVPEGYSQAPNMLSGSQHNGVELHYDETQSMEANVVVGLLQMAAGRSLFESFQPIYSVLGSRKSKGETGDGADPVDDPQELIKIHKRGVAIDRVQIASKHTFLAGIVPMFLLFSCAAAAHSLLDELKSGEIRRLLAAPILPAHILLGQQVSALIMALIQCYVMYIFAWLVFGVTIWNITGGLFVLTLATCLATTSFGMLLASLCRTGEQLDGIGTTVILAMSAIGGSMVPRFIMPSFMQPMGLFTINGWAYDGFLAVFRNEGFAGIAPICLVLVLIAVACDVVGSVLLTRRLRAGPGC